MTALHCAHFHVDMDGSGSLSKHCLCLQNLQLRLGRLRSTMWNWADGALCHLWTACAHAMVIVAGVPVDAREDLVLSGVAKVFRTKKQEEAPQTQGQTKKPILAV